MRTVIFFVFFSFLGIAQENVFVVTEAVIPPSSKHSIDVRPTSVYFNKGFFLGHGLSYQFNFLNNYSLNLSTDGVLVGDFDKRLRQHKNRNLVPRLNESEVRVSYNYIIRPFRHTKLLKYAETRVTASLGYHYFQQGTAGFFSEYWGVDSSDQRGLTVISGTQSHSVSIGLELVKKIYKIDGPRLRFHSSHQIGIDYFRNFKFQLKGVDLNDQENFDYRNLQNDFSVSKDGVRLNYRYTHSMSKKVNAYIDANVSYLPFFNYRSNSTYYAPRGGEGIFPLFSSMKLGVQFEL